METRGIRISDSKDNVLTVRLSDILEEVSDGSNLSWCCLFLDGTPNAGEESFVNYHKNKINKSKNGLELNWPEISSIDRRFHQIFEITILGCKTHEFLHRYDNDQEMYQSCDIVIELIDCAFWQIFSSNHELIDKLMGKFKETELLDPDFER